MRSRQNNIELTLSNAASQTLATHSFSIIGGGASFQIGPNINSSQQISFGIQSVAASHLGNQIVGFLVDSFEYIMLNGGWIDTQNFSAERGGGTDEIAILR